MINVTKTYLPPLDEYLKLLGGIWERGWIANHGPLVLELESKLKDFLGVKHLFLVSNGTVALQIAIKALELKKEIITTPFSYVATTSSIVWEGCKPVFCDINPENLTIDAELIEPLIHKNTSAILATHVFGIPCNVEKIKRIADKHGIKIIYDAAHAFNVGYRKKPILNYGNISILSFHATKLFHTAEGGAIVTNDDQVAHRISYMRNFGHNGYEDFWGLGINGKMSELHAAMGICLLPRVASIIETHKAVCEIYDTFLLPNSGLIRPKINAEVDYNYAYYPVIFPSENTLLKVRTALNSNDIFPRRYFYPSLNTLNYLDYQPTPIAEEISRKILCLPLYDELTEDEIKNISNIIRDNL